MTLAQTAIENHRQVRSGPERVNHRARLWLVTRTLSDPNPLLSACISAQIAIQTWRFGVIVPDDWKFEVWSFHLNCERKTDRVRNLEHKSRGGSLYFVYGYDAFDEWTECVECVSPGGWILEPLDP